MSDEEVEEHWKQIEEFPDYYVSDLGRIFNMRRKHLMALSWNGNNLYVQMVGPQGQKNRSVARIVRQYFPRTIVIDHSKTKFLTIKEFPRYKINWKGAVWDSKKKRYITVYDNKKAKYVRLFKNGRGYTRGLMKLIFDTYGVRREDGLQLYSERMERGSRIP